MMNILSIKRGEICYAVILMAVLLFWHGLIIMKFWPLFEEYDIQQWVRFTRNYHMSGFDPITYKVLTNWYQGYDILRHPLLAYMAYPFFMLNKGLWYITGTNCCQWITGVILFFCGFYGNMLLYRILHDIVGIARHHATLLCIWFLSFAYVIVGMIVADHFCLSFFCIMLTIYLAAKKWKNNGSFSIKECAILYLITSGVTLSNGVTVLLAVLFVNGRRFFSPKFLIGGVVIPTILLASVALVTYANVTSDESSKAVTSQWTDVSQDDNRWYILKENFFGESIQLHRKHILGDVLVNRPVIVEYSWKEQYYAEFIIVILFVCGIMMAHRKWLMWLSMAIFGFNIMLHIVLGFAMQEVYIMALHWCFVIPISIAFLFNATKEKKDTSSVLWKRCLEYGLSLVILGLTVYQWSYHSVLLYNYLTWPVK